MEQEKEKYLKLCDFNKMDINKINNEYMLGDAIAFGLAIQDFEETIQANKGEAFTTHLDCDRELIHLFLNFHKAWGSTELTADTIFEYTLETLKTIQEKINAGEFKVCDSCYSLIDSNDVIEYQGNSLCKSCMKKILIKQI